MSCIEFEMLVIAIYRKASKFWRRQSFAVIDLKFKPRGPTLKKANRRANSEDPDQTAFLGAVWSGSALFAQTYLSEGHYGSDGRWRAFL